ncbi:MAG: DNA gyrase inhibitor YacG [Pseudomonadota bacterium]
MACPICKSPTVAAHRPFCSTRCADVDLGRWMLGSYAIPLPESDEDERPDRGPDDS